MNISVPSDRFPTSLLKKTQYQALAFEKQTEGIRRLIWLYLVLWLIEGALRRWFLPGLASPLLLIRDPLVIAIYCLAVSNNLFPVNGFIVGGALLALLSFINAMVLGHGNLFVAIYGVRCDFLHVPLIFIMGRILQQKDIMALAKVAVWVAVPYTALMVAQFYQPQDAWVNRGVGGNMDGAGFEGAMDRFRPPGTFSFTTGPAQLYPLLNRLLVCTISGAQAADLDNDSFRRRHSRQHSNLHQPNLVFKCGDRRGGRNWGFGGWRTIFDETRNATCIGGGNSLCVRRPILDLS